MIRHLLLLSVLAFGGCREHVLNEPCDAECEAIYRINNAPGGNHKHEEFRVSTESVVERLAADKKALKALGVRIRD